jgi:hypothetical protein
LRFWTAECEDSAVQLHAAPGKATVVVVGVGVGRGGLVE